VAERKLVNTHVLEACETIFKYTEKRAEKARKRQGGGSDGKKDGQYAFSRSRQG
jgi:hypothetical protein